MIPVHLTFSGLYSYQKKQSIDFEKLTAAQLFGIFGAVGSGKSTILEAIMFVLYDRSDRLNKSGDNRYYNMLNLQSNKLEIDFVFRANAQGTTHYRAYFAAQRKKKDFEKVEVKERGQYEWKNGQWVPMQDADAASVLGMTYENFMQTVIIPQGKFREFIDQRPNVRTQMLKELFQLHRFDLGAKTGGLLRKTELAIADLEARLLEIGQVSEEELATQQVELSELAATLLQNQQRAANLDHQCQALDALKKLLDTITDTDRELKQLQEQSTFYHEKEMQLRAYMKAETFFNEKFRLLEETTIEYQETVEELKKLENRVAVGAQKVQKAKEEVYLRGEEYGQREVIRQKCQDLQHLNQISLLHPKCQQTAQQLAMILKQKESLEKAMAEQQCALSDCETQVAHIETQQAQWQVLQEVQLWIQRQRELVQEFQQEEKRLQKLENELAQLQDRKESVLSSYGWPGSSANEALMEDLSDFQTRLHSQQDSLQKEISELRVQEKLAQIASQLQPGQPCLLCGSTEHPQTAHHPSVKQALEEKQKELAELRQQEKTFRELQRAIQKIISQTETAHSTLSQTQERRSDLEKKIAQHQQHHRWPEYIIIDSETIHEQLEHMRREQQKLDTLQSLRRQLMEKLRELQQQREEVLRSEQTLLREQTGWQAKLEQHQTMLQVLNYQEFKEVTSTQLQEKLKATQQRLAAVEQAYEQAQHTLQEYQHTLMVLEERKEIADENCAKLARKADALNEEIQSLCLDKNFGNVSEVKQLIELELDTDSEQEEILTYRNQLHNAEVTLHKLQVEVQGRVYSEWEHRDLRQQLQTLSVEIQKQHESCTLLRQRIIDGQEKRERCQALRAQLEEQQLREANLKELLGLFRGSGFVNYASTVLLENLCRVANQRFMKLTHNSLSLELNSDNEFVVRDYLNDGKIRLLKTLSGGQTFQASLCLALALAENVKSLNHAGQSFFFLDEGFGSLDRASLRVVFDTLKSLRKENRVVGIISHVEELQHEIDVFLKIEKDRQKGSSIHPSWE